MTTTLMPLAFGFREGSEWVLILLVVLLLFGAKRLPDLAKSLGQGIKEFKKAMRDVTEDSGAAPKDSIEAGKSIPNGDERKVAPTATASSNNEPHKS